MTLASKPFFSFRQEKMKRVHILLLVVAIFLLLSGCGTYAYSCHKSSSLLQRAFTWDELWNTSTELMESARAPIEFSIDSLVFKDQLVTDKKEAESIMRTASEWGLRKTNVTVPPYRFEWRHGPTMEYANNTVYVSPETLTRFRDTDFALAAVHEVVGHHYQETNASNNDRNEQEGCAMSCEKMLFNDIAPSLVSRWRLMRYVRALIDKQINVPGSTKMSAREIYDHFGVYTMTLDTVVDSVTQFPGFSLNYLDTKKGAKCAC